MEAESIELLRPTRVLNAVPKFSVNVNKLIAERVCVLHWFWLELVAEAARPL